MSLADDWKRTFFETIGSEPFATGLRDASLRGELKAWTQVLTDATVQTCQRLGWLAAAKGHRLTCLPEAREEYLGLDVTAFDEAGDPWAFPVAAAELENSPRDDRIGYSLWKLLNIRTELRLLFCYRAEADQGTQLVRYLAESVVGPMDLARRAQLDGQTLVAVGYRNQAETFPHGFFKWWELNTNTGQFEQD